MGGGKLSGKSTKKARIGLLNINARPPYRWASADSQELKIKL